jgi:hypothetical protein
LLWLPNQILVDSPNFADPVFRTLHVLDFRSSQIPGSRTSQVSTILK